MSRCKKVFFSLFVACATLGNAQNLHLSQQVFFENDTIDGVAYFANERLLDHTYYVSIFSEEEVVVARELIFATRENTLFQLVVPEGTPSGYYTLQLSNYHNAVVTHTVNLLLLNEDDWTQVKVQPIKEQVLPRSAKSGINFQVSEIEDQAILKFTPSELVKSAIKNVSVSVKDLRQNPLSLDSEIQPLSQPPCNLKTRHMVSDQNLQGWLYGYQVTGTVTNEQNIPIVDCPVIFSYTQERLVYNYTRTNEVGRFGFFNLDVNGTFDGYIQALNQDTTKSIKVHIQLPKEGLGYNFLDCEKKFYIDSAQLAEIVRVRMLQKKVSSTYAIDEKKAVWTPAEPKPLLRSPDHLIKIDDYVAFNTTKEVFKEIVPHAFLVQRRLRVFSPELKKTLSKLPLLLINGIPARDNEILELPPHEIAYIEILNEITKLAGYGDYALGGIISIITKNDFEHGTYLNKVKIEGFAPKSRLIQPVKIESAPFFPSVLYWNPQLKSTSESFDFSIDLPAYRTKVLVSAVFQLTNGSIVSHEEIVNLNNKYED
ncbi:MAG: hypothetical protein ABJP45_08900 [Cyclobacteriaceae bacterium]